ncbi:MAG: hypothetical protein ACM31C_14340 [Acidobacteriota bacterium]
MAHVEPAPVHRPEHHPAARPVATTPKPDRKKPASGSAWDPDSLFAPK